MATPEHGSLKPPDLTELLVMFDQTRNKLEETVKEKERYERYWQEASLRAEGILKQVDSLKLELQALDEELRTANALKTETYMALIKELFEAPSQLANRTTMRVAKLSIIASVAVSVLLSMAQTIYTNVAASAARSENLQRIAQTSKRSEELITHLMTKQEQLKVDLNRTIQDNDDRLQRRLDAVNPRTQVILAAVRKLQPEFGGYFSQNDLRLCYKVKLALQFHPTPPELYLAAFREAGIKPSVIPTDTSIIQQWDLEMLALYERWLATLRMQPNQNAPAPDDLKTYSTFKSQSDTTSYTTWQRTGSVTVAKLIEGLESERRVFLNQKVLHK